MRRIICAIGLLLSLANWQTAKEVSGQRTVLASSKLLACNSSACSQLWSERPEKRSAVFLKQVIIDMNKDCLYAMTARYDKSIAVEGLKRAIDWPEGLRAPHQRTKSLPGS
jgi:hypothetical protein